MLQLFLESAQTGSIAVVVAAGAGVKNISEAQTLVSKMHHASNRMAR